MVLNGTPESGNGHEEQEDSTGNNPADNVETKSDHKAKQISKP